MSVPRSDIAQLRGISPRLIAAMERALNASEVTGATAASAAAATEAMDAATVITLSANTAFKNERVLALGSGIVSTDTVSALLLDVSPSVARATGGFTCTFAVAGNSTAGLPLSGMLATTTNAETLRNKTLDAPKVTGLGNYTDDAAAATGGVLVGGVYRNGSKLMVRVA